MTAPRPRFFAASAAFGGAVGAAFGGVEVALRAVPRLGLAAADLAGWWVASVGMAAVLGGAVGLASGLILGGRAQRWSRPRGLTVGVLAGTWLATTWRYEFVLNDYVRNPRVWGGLLLAGAIGLVGGWALDGLLRRTRIVGALLVVAVVSHPVVFVRGRAPVAAPARSEGGTSLSGGGGGVPLRNASPILVITLDTVRRDRLAPYGHDIETPNLSRLAREGVVFEDAVAAAPITEPSHLAMFTGIPPIANGIVSNGTILGERPLVWSTLRAEGWTTAGFVAGFPLHGRYGWTQGMDLYDDDFGRVPGLQSLTLVKAWNQVALRDHALRERPAAQVLARAVPWLRANREGRYFAWVHLYDAHGPYDSPHNDALGEPPRKGPPLAKLPSYWPARDRAITSPAWLAMAYDAELRTVDDAIGALLEALGPELDRTLVVVLADHGESLGEHDVWFDHGDDLYDPVLRIPWIVRYPPVARAGLRVPCQVGAVDLAPTILGLAGVRDAVAREGIDRTPELVGAPCRATPVLATTVAGRQVTPPPVDHAVRADARKTILHAGGAVEHYDLAADPFERVNRAADPVSDAAAALLRDRAGAVTGAESDRTTQSLLEALGYVDAAR